MTFISPVRHIVNDIFHRHSKWHSWFPFFFRQIVNDILDFLFFFRHIVNDIQQRANIIQSSLGSGGQVQQGGGGGGGASPQLQLAMHEVQENLRLVKTDISQLLNRPQVSYNELLKLRKGRRQCHSLSRQSLFLNLFTGFILKLITLVGLPRLFQFFFINIWKPDNIFRL